MAELYCTRKPRLTCRGQGGDGAPGGVWGSAWSQAEGCAGQLDHRWRGCGPQSSKPRLKGQPPSPSAPDRAPSHAMPLTGAPTHRLPAGAVPPPTPNRLPPHPRVLACLPPPPPPFPSSFLPGHTCRLPASSTQDTRQVITCSGSAICGAVQGRTSVRPQQQQSGWVQPGRHQPSASGPRLPLHQQTSTGLLEDGQQLWALVKHGLQRHRHLAHDLRAGGRGEGLAGMMRCC